MNILLRSVFVAGLLSSALPAFADETAPLQLRPGFQLRMDATSTETDKNGKDTTTDGFLLYRARMAVGGDLDQNTSFFVRLDVMFPYDTPADVGTDNAIGNLERAYIEHRPLPGLALRFGRFPFMTGSIEWDYSSMDQYIPSHLNDIINFPIYPETSGVEATYKLYGQSLTVQVLNGVSDPSSTQPHNTGKQDGENLTTAVGYRGNFAQGIVKPILTYNTFSRIRNNDAVVRDDRAVYHAYGLGSQFSLMHVDLDLEYDEFDRPQFNSFTWDTADKATEILHQADKLSTEVGQIAYTATELKLRFWAKQSIENEKVGSVRSATFHRDGFGIEFRPGYRTFRYHVALLDKHDTDYTGVSPVRTNVRQYILGVAAKI